MTFDNIDALLHELNSIATDSDKYCFGLPTHNETDYKVMRSAVERCINSYNVQSSTGKRALQVWQFSYNVDYGSGIALVAAIDQVTAETFMSSQSTGFGRWVLEYTEPINGLTFETSDNVQLITSNTYAQ